MLIFFSFGNNHFMYYFTNLNPLRPILYLDVFNIVAVSEIDGMKSSSSSMKPLCLLLVRLGNYFSLKESLTLYLFLFCINSLSNKLFKYILPVYSLPLVRFHKTEFQA